MIMSDASLLHCQGNGYCRGDRAVSVAIAVSGLKPQKLLNTHKSIGAQAASAKAVQEKEKTSG